MNTLEQTIGNTPLVKLQRLGPDNDSEVWVKLEGNNPAGSVKDRAALSMIVEAEKRGEIQPGDADRSDQRQHRYCAGDDRRAERLPDEAVDARQHEPERRRDARLRRRAYPGQQRARDGGGPRLALRWPSAEKANCSISLTTRITPTPTTPPPGRKSGSRPRGVSPTLSPVWGPPAPLPACHVFCVNRVNR